MAEWLTDPSGTDRNVKRSDDGPKGEGRDSPSNALQGSAQERLETIQRTHTNGEVAEWLKALPC